MRKCKNGKLELVLEEIIYYFKIFNVAGSDEKLRSGQISKYSSHLIKIACEVAIGKK